MSGSIHSTRSNSLRNSVWVSMWISLSVVVLTGLGSTAAHAQLPFSVRLAAVGGLHQSEVSASVNGVEIGSAPATMYTAGVELDFGTPLGLNVGLQFLRHFGDLSDSFDDVPDALSFGLGANEFGIFVEERLELVPTSPVQPFLGIGVGYGRISLGEELLSGELSLGSLEGDIDVFRVYALGGLQVFGSLGVKARAGYMFGSIQGDELSFGQTVTTESGDEVGFELDYGGFFASLAVSLFGF